MKRIIAAIGTLLVALTLVGGLTSTSQAAVSDGTPAAKSLSSEITSERSTAASAAAKPFRPVNARLRQPRPGGTIFINGFVTRWPYGAVYVQQARCPNRCPWSNYRVTRTSVNNYFNASVFAPRTGRMYWRAFVRPYGRYREGIDIAGYTFRR